MNTMEPTATQAGAPPPRLAIGDILSSIVKSPAFLPGLVMLVGVLLAFWPLIERLPPLWLEGDGYYSHGFLVPLISAYIVYRRWDKLKDIPVKPGWVALILMLPLLFVLRAANKAEILLLMSFGLMATLFLGVWFAAGLRWAFALSLPILYLLFALPIWTMAIDMYTNPLQQLSTDVAYMILKTIGMQPYQPTPTVIYLDRFTLDVAVPCSGLKLVLAVTAFTVFFTLIARLKWWANTLMFALILPLCLIINGLRIALIGIVGNQYGWDAGIKFHDYSGYITLIICFVILFKIARGLGWKD